jgi:hypothetical protein
VQFETSKSNDPAHSASAEILTSLRDVVKTFSRSSGRGVFAAWFVGITGSNPFWGMGVCLFVYIMFCSASVEAFKTN